MRGNLILGEERIQLKSSFIPENGRFRLYLKDDFYHDWVEDDWEQDFREGYLDLSAGKVGLRIGRQMLTWGTGDLLFVNDVFPKDWEAFYSGRPLEYLKRGVDGVKADVYSDLVSIEAVAIPFFTADRLPSPGRFHLFEPFPGALQSEITEPDSTAENMEFALRLYRNVLDAEMSAYAYRGYFRIPGAKAGAAGMLPGALFYPELAVYGLSVQGSTLGGVLSGEFGYYDSLDDEAGVEPGIPNSHSRFLLGYQRAFPGELTAGIQYYAELMHDYGNYKTSLPAGFPAVEELHQYAALRVTRLLRYQTLKVSLFGLYSPDEEDFFIIPEVSYNVTDNLQASLGGNVFGGGTDTTTFGQHDEDDNLYVILRYSFQWR